MAFLDRTARSFMMGELLVGLGVTRRCAVPPRW